MAQSEIKAGEFQFKPSGFGNLTGGNASGEPRGGVGGVSENELELSPQYRIVSGTIFAARGVLNVDGSVAGPLSAWEIAVPEVSVFAVGDFGRVEIGERAGFPQSLIGFTPSEIAFTAAEFGPESGARLDPNGRLPTTLLPPALAARINGLTYLGYAERFYDDNSAKLIYVSPRSRNGFYGALSYTPETERRSAFRLDGTAPRIDTPADAPANPGTFRHVLQAAGVWNYRNEMVDLATGVTYSHGDATHYISTNLTSPALAGTLSPVNGSHSDSLSGGVTATLNDTWVLGVSGTYDGLSKRNFTAYGTASSGAPYGVVASFNYVAGSWIAGGYYQHATATSIELRPNRDAVNIGEIGVSYLVDKSHDLLGMGRYTDLKLFASLYNYHFESTAPLDTAVKQDGVVILIGGRFSFY